MLLAGGGIVVRNRYSSASHLRNIEPRLNAKDRNTRRRAATFQLVRLQHELREWTGSSLHIFRRNNERELAVTHNRRQGAGPGFATGTRRLSLPSHRDRYVDKSCNRPAWSHCRPCAWSRSHAGPPWRRWAHEGRESFATRSANGRQRHRWSKPYALRVMPRANLAGARYRTASPGTHAPGGGGQPGAFFLQSLPTQRRAAPPYALRRREH